jgi:hypothetical protein
MTSEILEHPLIQTGRHQFVNATDCNLREDPRFHNIRGVAILPEHKQVYGEQYSWEPMEAMDIYGHSKRILFIRLEEIHEQPEQSDGQEAAYHKSA